jgi:transcription initiation factor TFIIIB Brf1 subunit/transcription initiation factor TFIIB
MCVIVRERTMSYYDYDLVPGANWHEYSSDYNKFMYPEERDMSEFYVESTKVTRVFHDKFTDELKHTAKRVLDITDSTIITAQELFRDFRATNLKRGSNMKGSMAACAYFACKLDKRPLPVLLFSNAFQISNTKMNKCCTELLEALSDKPYHSKLLKETCSEDLLTQMVYQVDDITDKWAVIKMARKIINKIHTHPSFKTQKPSKINVTIIFIACTMLGLNIPKHVYQNDLNVSALTMINHEKLIQGILQA